MQAPHPSTPHQPPEQLLYATWLTWGARVGLVVIVLGFLTYVSGLVPSAVSPQRLQELWALPVRDYLQQAGTVTGWSACLSPVRGDGLALLGIMVLVGCSVPALLALAGLALRGRDRVLAALCGLEVMIIVLAASGWLAGGH